MSGPPPTPVHPGALLHTCELARDWCYPLSEPVRRWQRQAIVRAAKKVAVRVGRDRRGVIFGVKRSSGLMPVRRKPISPAPMGLIPPRLAG